jgi:amidophosphoribosyltransferase
MVHFDHDDDKPREECGVFGIFGNHEASLLTALGLHALQHRGQEACGITSFDGKRFPSERHMGMVGDHFGGDLRARLTGPCRHRPYTAIPRQAPADAAQCAAAVRGSRRSAASPSAHNGNLTNAIASCAAAWCAMGLIFQSTMDTEVIIHLVARSQPTIAAWSTAWSTPLNQVEGGYSLVCMTGKKLIGAARSGTAFARWSSAAWATPTSCARKPAPSTSSAPNSCATVENPGEIVVIDDKGMRIPSLSRPAPAVLHLRIHLLRTPGQHWSKGRSVYEVRKADRP